LTGVCLRQQPVGFALIRDRPLVFGRSGLLYPPACRRIPLPTGCLSPTPPPIPGSPGRSPGISVPGARDTFLDEADIQHGDDIEERIYQAANESQELLVLLTPWAITRPYIWMEIGLFWGAGKRIVGVLHGLSQQELATDGRIPLLLKRGKMLDINRIDGYFDELEERVKARETLP